MSTERGPKVADLVKAEMIDVTQQEQPKKDKPTKLRVEEAPLNVTIQERTDEQDRNQK